MPGISMSDLITRLNAALKGRYRVERELDEGGMTDGSTWPTAESSSPSGVWHSLARYWRAPPPWPALRQFAFQNPERDSPCGLSRSFSNARLRICLMRSRVTPRSDPITSKVLSSPSSRP